MLDLLKNYSITEILTFLVLLAFAIKGVISFFDWAYARLQKVFNKTSRQEQQKIIYDEYMLNNNHQVEEIIEQQKQILSTINDLQKDITILRNADKDDIKAWITQQHHYFCYETKKIDDYSLDCIEKRYTHYIEEGGNSFIHSLMEEIRRLPKASLYNNNDNNK